MGAVRTERCAILMRTGEDDKSWHSPKVETHSDDLVPRRKSASKQDEWLA